MLPDPKKTTGALALFAALQFTAAMFVSESLYPDYDRAQNFISDLGVGSTAAIFNTSIILAGILTLAAAYFGYTAYKNIIIPVAVGIVGLSFVGIGVFPEDTGDAHTWASNIAFFLGALIAIGSYKFSEKPAAYLFALLGMISLAAALLYSNGIYFGLGVGLAERVIVYPFLLWAILFGLKLLTTIRRAPC